LHITNTLLSIFKIITHIKKIKYPYLKPSKPGILFPPLLRGAERTLWNEGGIGENRIKPLKKGAGYFL